MSGISAPPVLSPEALAAVGYKPSAQATPQAASQPVLSPEALAAVGYKQPSAAPQQQQQAPVQASAPLGSIDNTTQALQDFNKASIAETGSLGAGVLANVGKLTGNEWLKSFSKDQSDFNTTVNRAQESSPIAGTIGKLGTDAVGVLGTGVLGNSIKAVAGTGALAGLASSKEDSPIPSILTGAIAGGAAGGLTALATDAIPTILTGARLAFKNPDQFADAAIKATIGATGDIKPADVFSKADSMMKEAAQTNKANYAARNQAAAEANNGSGILVDRNNLAKTISQLKGEASGTTSQQVRSAINAGMDAMQSGAPLSFKAAQTAVSNLGGEAVAANRAGNSILAMHLGELKNAMSADIEAAVPANTPTAFLHQKATDYARDVYYPLQNANLDKVIADRASETSFLTNLLKSGLKQDQPNMMNAMTAMDPTTHQQVVGAMINSLKAAVTETGDHVNLQRFSRVLTNLANDHGPAVGEYLQPIKTLSNVMMAAAKSSKGGAVTSLPGLIGGVGGFAGGGVAGAGIGAASGALISKTPFLYAAGKMISNPDSIALLKSAENIQKYPNSDMVPVINNKVKTLYGNVLKNVPARFAAAMGTEVGGNL